MVRTMDISDKFEAIAKNMSFGMIGLFILLIVAFGVMRFVVSRFAQRRRDAGNATPKIHLLRAIALSWLAPVVVMSVFAGLSGIPLSDLENRIRTVSPTSIPVTPEIPKPSTNAGQSIAPVALESGKDASPEFSRPNWIAAGDSNQGDIRTIVLSSQLWSSEAEARQELLPRVASIVRNDFRERHQNFLDQTGHLLLSDEVLIEHAVKRQYVERIEQDFGTFSAPMWRLWTQVEISPMVRTEIYPVWKKAVASRRAILVGALLAGATMLANAASLFAQLHSVPRRSFLGTSAIVATSILIWFAADLLLVKQLCQ